MTRYELYLFVHVGAVAVWVGAGFAMALLETRASLAGSAVRVVALAREGASLGPRLYLPANLLVLVSAVLLVEDGSWGYGALWIQLGFAGFALSFLLGALVFAPGWPRLVRLAESEGVGSPGIRPLVGRLLVGSWIDVGVLLGVIFVMASKPGADDAGALVATAAIVVACVAVPFALLRAGEARAPGTDVPVGTSPSE